jgi:hypothetical protein
MLRQVALFCAAGLLAAGVGCAFKLGNVAQVEIKPNDQVVNDTLEHVAQRIQNEMQRLGLQVAVAPSADAVSITSTTKSGQRFVITLVRANGPQGTQTTIHVDWDQAADRDLWLQLMTVAVSSR